MRLNNVLIALDLSAESEATAEFASNNLLDSADRVDLVSVVPEWTVPVAQAEYLPSPEIIDQYNADLLRHAEGKLVVFKDKYFKGREVETKVIRGINSPAQEICDYARARGCDAIVSGTHGSGVLSNLFIGSTVQRVIKLSHCPVLVVPKQLNEKV